MKVSEEFIVGKHDIGWISNDFKKAFKDQEFESRETPTFQKLLRGMKDTDIEEELKPGFCELGDVVAFMDNSPEGTKDDWGNLFYLPSFVVRVGWFDDAWDVGAWLRDEYAWRSAGRVFSPATHSESKSFALESSDTQSLLAIVLEIEQGLAKIKKIIGV